MIGMEINGERAEAPEGSRLLDVLLSNGVYVPHLCFLEDDAEPYAACRLCLVQVEGFDDPQYACQVMVVEGMSVNTKSVDAFELAKSVFSLILLDHDAHCMECAFGNTASACEIRRAARYFSMPLRSTWQLEDQEDVSRHMETHGLKIDHDSCILCGRCVRICAKTGNAFLGMANRGSATQVITDLRIKHDRSACIECRQCLASCPTASLSL